MKKRQPTKLHRRSRTASQDNGKVVLNVANGSTAPFLESSGLCSLRLRLEGVTKILMAHREAGALLPNATKGNERETLVREFLSRVFPPPFRFGTGAIVDADGRSSGQLDVAVEFPLLPSFPTPGALDRLYLADSAALVIEVKSNLTAQWDQVRASARRVLLLRRHWHAHASVSHVGALATFPSMPSVVPFLAVGYGGPSAPDKLKRLLDETPPDERPDGALVIKSGAYTGCRFSDWKYHAVGAAGLLAFCADMSWLARNIVWARQTSRATCFH